MSAQQPPLSLTLEQIIERAENAINLGLFQSATSGTKVSKDQTIQLICRTEDLLQAYNGDDLMAPARPFWRLKRGQYLEKLRDIKLALQRPTPLSMPTQSPHPLPAIYKRETDSRPKLSHPNGRPHTGGSSNRAGTGAAIQTVGMGLEEASKDIPNKRLKMVVAAFGKGFQQLGERMRKEDM